MVWKVESADWVLSLTDDDIEAATDEGTFDRGYGYAEDEMVTQAAALNRGRVLVATVLGSGHESYQTIVSLEGDSRAPRTEWSSRCSCPVGARCKHAVAVLLTVRDVLGGPTGIDTAPAAPWEATLERLSAPAPVEPLRDGDVLALVFEQVIEPGRGRGAADSRKLLVRPTRWTRLGRWAKKFSWAEADSESYNAVAIKRSHRRAVRFLLALQHPAAARARSYAVKEPAVHLDAFGGEVWIALRRAEQAGIALLASDDGDPARLLAEPVEAVVDVTRDADGVCLTPKIVWPDPTIEPDDVHLLGDPVHGLSASVDGELVLAPFAATLGTGTTDLLRGGEVLVPAADVDRFLAMYLGRLREQVTVISSDGSVDLPEPTPPRLHIRVGGEGEALRLDLGFVYAAGSQERVVPAAAGGAVPRDAKGEQALLTALGDLREVPGAVVRATGSTQRRLVPQVLLRGATAIAVVTEVLPALEVDERVVVEHGEDVPAYEHLDEEPVIAVHEAGEAAGSDWLDLRVSVTVGEVAVPFEPLFAALVRGEEIMLLESGEWFRLDHPVLTDLRALIEEAGEITEPEAGELRLSRYQVGLWDDLSGIADVAVPREHDWRARVEALRDLDTTEPPPVPDGLRATLRPYQLEGYHWLTTLWDAGLGGVLADDMGLGKTVQTLALLARAAAAGELDRPVLVVAPTSVVGTWASEAHTFVPDLEVRTLGRTSRTRGQDVAEAVAGAQLVVTSYAVLRIDADEFAAVDWRGVVIDEAQFVKNDRAKAHQAIRRLSTPFVLAVTGTPLENSLMDLWSLLALAAPGLYPHRERFVRDYRKPIESGERPELLDRMRRRVRPLMLRRTKEQVALDLPPKQVQVLPVDLTPGHRRLYDRHLQRERKRVLGLLADPEANRVAILASITRLRQLSLDPGLVDDEHRGQVTSAKIELLVEQLRELGDEGHRALVFSQFTSYLRLVRERLDAEGITTSYLDGATTDRAGVIDEFRTGDSTAFLISLKAGGVGLTLTEADYVFVLDPWWNPAAEAQAIDRAHRIGQERPVMVYRLVSTGTIEEKVLALQERKRDLFQRVVDDGGALSGAITNEDIRALLDVE